MNMKFLIIPLLASGLYLSSCHTEHYVAEQPLPPPAVVERPLPPPGRTYYVDYDYRWDGTKYVVVPGYYIKERKGRVWVPGHWAKKPGGFYWIPGHWK